MIKDKQKYKNHFKEKLIDSLKLHEIVNWELFINTPDDDEKLSKFHCELNSLIQNLITKVKGVN